MDVIFHCIYYDTKLLLHCTTLQQACCYKVPMVPILWTGQWTYNRLKQRDP